MFKKPISLAVTLMGTSAVAWMAACGSSSNNNNGGSSSSSSSSNSTTSSASSTKSVSSGSSSSATTDGGPADAGGASICTDTLSSTSTLTVDNMQVAGEITLAPPSCGARGEWYSFTTQPGTSITPPTTAAPFPYSPLPTGFPGPAPEGGSGAASDASADAGSGTGAACVSGTTLATQYDSDGLGLQLGNGPGGADGGAGLPVLFDASAFTGVEFWLWTSAATATAVNNSLIIQFFDKNSTKGFGVCNAADVNGTGMIGDPACGAAGAAIMGAPVASSNSAGAVPAADGGGPLAAITAGWQLIQIPWTTFVTNPYYGGGNETTLDPTTLTKLQFQIQQTVNPDAGGAPVTYDFCVVDVAFYH